MKHLHLIVVICVIAAVICEEYDEKPKRKSRFEKLKATLKNANYALRLGSKQVAAQLFRKLSTKFDKLATKYEPKTDEYAKEEEFKPDYQEEQKPDYKEEVKPDDYKPELKPDYKEEVKPDYKPNDYKPEIKPEVKPDEFKPDIKPDYQEEQKPDYKEEVKPDEYKPELKPDYKPNDYKPEIKPEVKPDEYKPELKPDYKEEVKPDYKPDDYKPEIKPELKPDYKEEVKPGEQKPEIKPDLKPDEYNEKTEEYQPNSNPGDYKPVEKPDDYKPNDYKSTNGNPYSKEDKKELDVDERRDEKRSVETEFNGSESDPLVDRRKRQADDYNSVLQSITEKMFKLSKGYESAIDHLRREENKADDVNLSKDISDKIEHLMKASKIVDKILSFLKSNANDPKRKQEDLQYLEKLYEIESKRIEGAKQITGDKRTAEPEPEKPINEPVNESKLDARYQVLPLNDVEDKAMQDEKDLTSKGMKNAHEFEEP